MVPTRRFTRLDAATPAGMTQENHPMVLEAGQVNGGFCCVCVFCCILLASSHFFRGVSSKSMQMWVHACMQVRIYVCI